MTTRRVVLVLAAAAVVLGLGAVLLAVTGDSDASRVEAIVLAVLGLVCLRALFWIRKVRVLTRAGLAQSEPRHPPG